MREAPDCGPRSPSGCQPGEGLVITTTGPTPAIRMPPCASTDSAATASHSPLANDGWVPSRAPWRQAPAAVEHRAMDSEPCRNVPIHRDLGVVLHQGQVDISRGAGAPL